MKYEAGMKIALAQINPTVGDIEANTAMILDRIESAMSAGATLAVFPEMAIFGYPPKDLLLRKDMIERNVKALRRVADACGQLTAVVGFAQPDPTGAGTGLFNSAAVCHAGRIVTYAKRLLPTYDVFDERRYFNPGECVRTFMLTGDKESVCVGLTVCEDLWNDRQFDGRKVYHVDPIAQSVEAGARLLVNLSASPYRAGAQQSREALFAAQAKQFGIPVVYVNQAGGQDDLLFDGTSAVFNAKGQPVGRAKAFEEDLLIVELGESDAKPGRVEVYPDRIDGIRKALVLGIRDYLARCGFERAIVGLSGGIDSSLTAALAVEALGAERVLGVAMPSRFSSAHSFEDAQQLAENLDIRLSVVPIEPMHRAMEQALAASFAEHTDQGIGAAEENMQARIRGNILMSLSNKSGSLLLSTGNKSEWAVGYCTLYGDMCGGLAVLSDVPKMMVYALARRINESAGSAVIPKRTIDKAPSAELHENQLDQNTLPPYDLLDAVLERYVERDQTVDQIVDEGFDRAVVEKVARMVDRSEYKRKQAPVGLKVTSRAFGTGRRMPIAAKHR